MGVGGLAMSLRMGYGELLGVRVIRIENAFLSIEQKGGKSSCETCWNTPICE